MSRAFDVQNQRVGAMANDMSRASAELGDLRLRYEGAMATNGQLQQQVGGRWGRREHATCNMLPDTWERREHAACYITACDASET